MEPLKIHLLGEFRVYLGEGRLDLPTKKIKSLLAYLVTYRQRGFPPELLAGTFWGESSEAKARASLHSALSALQRALPDTVIREYGNLRFNPRVACWLDVEEFEQRLKESRRLKRPEDKLSCLRRAVELYQGDFLEGFYDDWCIIEQERLRELYLGALKELAAYHKARKEYDQAIKCCRMILERSPLREEVQRELIYLYYLSGDRNAALLQYEGYYRTLKEELGIEPLPETTMLYKEIKKRADLESLRLLTEPLLQAELLLTRYPELGAPFTGRARELEGLLAHWQQAEEGQGSVVLIEGEAGIGKSRLARELIERLGGRALILIGRCYRMEQGLPFSPLVEALRQALRAVGRVQLALAEVPPLWLAAVASLLPELARLLPEGRLNPPLPPAQERLRLFEGLNQLVFALSRAQPLLLFLDDLHWADDATLQYLYYLARHIPEQRILLLCAYRPEEANEALEELLGQLGHEGLLARLRLDNLSKGEVHELVTGMLKTEQGLAELIDLIYNETEGNPFFAVEMVKSLVGGGALYPDERGRWQVAVKAVEDYIPADVRELIEARLRRVSGSARRLLELAAVLGREFELECLVQADSLEEDRLAELLEELLRSHLLVEQDGRYAFTHELFRQVVYKDLSAARRRRLHLRAGQALETIHKEHVERVAGELAWHFRQAEQREKALDYLIVAGRRAQEAYANREALEFFKQAEEVANELESRVHGHKRLALWEKKFDLLEMRAAIYGTIYDILGAKAQLERDIGMMIELARSLGDELRLARAFQKRAELWFALGRHREALDETRKALEMMQSLGDRRAAGEALKNLAAFHVQLGEYAQGLEYYRQASQLYEQLGDKREQAHALRRIGITHQILGQYEGAKRYYQGAQGLYDEVGDREGQGAILNNLGLIHYAAGEYAVAAECYGNALEKFSEIGDRRGQGIVLINLGTLHNELKEYDKALGHLEEALLIAREPGMKGLEIEALSQMALAYLGLGERTKALERSSSAVQLLEQGGQLVESQVILFNHSRVLAANRMEGEAASYLEGAYRELMRKANSIKDGSARETFLRGVRANREIIGARAGRRIAS